MKRAIIILAVVAIIAGLGAMTLSIPIQQAHAASGTGGVYTFVNRSYHKCINSNVIHVGCY